MEIGELKEAKASKSKSQILTVGDHYEIELPDEVMEYLKVKVGDTIMVNTGEKSIILSRP